MTPSTRPAFELLRFTAAPVGDALALVDVEGRFGLGGRFARRPSLVVELADGNRLELAPVRVDAEGDRWRAAYAVPVETLADARFGLAVRGALVELPAPDRLTEPDGRGHGDRTVELAREANALRRELERAEAQVAQAEDHAEAAEERAAAAEADASEAQARIGVLERAVRELEQRILVAEGEAEEAEHSADVARERARRSEHELRAAQQELSIASDRAQETHRRITAAEQRAAAAEEQRAEAERRARAAGEGLEVLRAELAEERARRLSAADEVGGHHPLPPRPEATDPPTLNDELLEVDEADDGEERDRTPPGGIVRTHAGTHAGAYAAPRAPAAVRHVPGDHGSAGPGRWLAVLALVLLVVVVAALVLGLRA